MPEGPSLYNYAKRIIFPRPSVATYGPATHPDELLHIPCVDEETTEPNGEFTYGYLLRNKGSTHLLIYAHPNGVDIGMVYQELRASSAKVPIDVLLFEYSGYGLTTTPVTEKSVNVDTASAYWFARRYLHTPPSQVVFCGRSLGAATAAKFCSSLRPPDTPCLLVLQCPFTTLSECAHSFAVEGAASVANFLGYNWFRTIDIIADVECPVALHHGSMDSIVPMEHSLALKGTRDSAAQPRVTYFYKEEGKGHNNLSNSLLAQILQDRIGNACSAASPALINTPWPAISVAHPSLYSFLFEREKGSTLRAAHTRWQSTLRAEPYLRSRAYYFAILTASVCSFTMRVARVWQIYSAIYRKHSKSLSGFERISKTQFILRYTALWGSPLGVHIPIPGVSDTEDALIFGCRIPPHKWRSLDCCWDFTDDNSTPRLTIAEVPLTERLIKVIGRGIATAPDMPDLMDVPCFLHADIVSDIQIECERIAAYMSDDRAATLCDLFTSLESQCQSLMSPKSRCLRGFSYSQEAFGDLSEWLRPYVAESVSPADGTAPAFFMEVPWDYYLFKGRVLAYRTKLTTDMDWEECSRAMGELEIVATIHQFFLRHHREIQV